MVSTFSAHNYFIFLLRSRDREAIRAKTLEYSARSGLRPFGAREARLVRFLFELLFFSLDEKRVDVTKKVKFFRDLEMGDGEKNKKKRCLSKSKKGEQNLKISRHKPHILHANKYIFKKERKK